MGRENNNEGHGGQGRGGRAGRGCGRTSPDSKQQAPAKYKEAEMKFQPYGTISGKTNVTFQTVKDHIV
jgi:hypothetical protein